MKKDKHIWLEDIRQALDEIENDIDAQDGKPQM